MKKLIFILCSFIVFASCTLNSKKKEEPTIQLTPEPAHAEPEKPFIALPQKIDSSALNKHPILIKVDTGMKAKEIKMMKRNIHPPYLDTIVIH